MAIGYRDQQSVEVVRAGPARPHVRGDAREALRRVVAASDQLDITMQQPHRLRTADITRVCLTKRSSSDQPFMSASTSFSLRDSRLSGHSPSG